MYNSPYAYPNPYQITPQMQHAEARPQVVRVNGRNGAEAYQMPANASVLLLDETAPIIWLKQTDGAGYPTLAAYDISPHQEAPAPDMRSLEERITKLEEAMTRNEPNYSSNIRKLTDGPGPADNTDNKRL